MIRFVTGMFTIIAGVAAIEGSAPFGVGILMSTVGVLIMCWGIVGMAEKGQL
jgi:hypothetical protein|tara:strand:- start:1052 stop:1207 length:156 start_codon:yes stop_codon:yes gene_type:complete